MGDSVQKGCSTRARAANTMASEDINLVQYINQPQSFCLNECKEHNYRNALDPVADPAVFLQSDCDEASGVADSSSAAIVCLIARTFQRWQELLIHIAFSQNVQVTGLQIKGPADKGVHPRHAACSGNVSAPLTSNFPCFQDHPSLRFLRTRSLSTSILQNPRSRHKS